MFKHLLLPVLAIGIISCAYAQCPDKTGITTDPAAPVNPQVSSAFPAAKLNGFNWLQPSYSLNWIYTYNNSNRIDSPFYQDYNTNITTFVESKDMYPKDGWEVIRYEFGYNDDGTLKNPAATTAYMILYNKYSGLLRVFVARGDQKTFNGATIRVSFTTDSGMKTSLLDINGKDMRALENFTFVPELASGVRFIDQPFLWFYTDFPMQYDPCTCFYKSKIAVETYATSTSSISLSGTTTGTLVANGVPSAEQQSNGVFSSIKDLGTAGSKIVESYNSIDKFQGDINKKIDALSNIFDKDSKKGALTTLVGKLKESNFGKVGLGAIAGIDVAVSLIDFFSGGGKKSAAPQQVTLTPMAINMTSTYTGTLGYEERYAAVPFRTPGSDVSDLLDKNLYPYYNEVLGVFNLLKTPKISIREYTYYNSYSGGGYGSSSYVGYIRKVAIKFAEDVQYTVNPASNLVVQDIQMAILGKSLFDYAYTSYQKTTPPISSNTIVAEATNATTGDNEYRTSYKGGGYYFFASPTSYSSNYTNPGNMRLKIMVNLRRKDAVPNDNTQNVLYVATYPLIVDYSFTDAAGFAAFTNNSTDNSSQFYGSYGSFPGLRSVSTSEITTFCSSTAYKVPARGFSRYGKNVATMLENEKLASSLLITDLSDFFYVYPNPAKDRVFVKYGIKAPGNVKITLADISGRSLATVLNTTIPEAGNFETQINTEPYSSGLYLVIIESQNRRDVKKIVIAK